MESISLHAGLASEIAARLGEANVRLDEPMSEHTTFRIGGSADVYCEPGSVDEIRFVVSACRQAGAPLHVMGRGSDLLIADAGLRGVVLRLGPRFSTVKVDGCDVFATSGAANSHVGEVAAKHSLAGFEFACGIPGTIGGAAIMNAGAYGGEFSQICVDLICLDAQGDFVGVPREDAAWSYRHSMMDEEGLLILQAHLVLEPGSERDIRSRMLELAFKRREKQPLEMPSAGSTFKRPEGGYASKLIDDAGLRGLSVGGAQVSRKHTGFIVNTGGATAQDVRMLIDQVRQRVEERFGVDLQPEVRMWGFDEE